MTRTIPGLQATVSARDADVARNASRDARRASSVIGVLLAFALATSARAATTFVSPLESSQVLGPTVIEITTDVRNIDRVDFTIDGVLAGVARQAPYRIAHDFGASFELHTIEARVWSNGFEASEVATIRTLALASTDSYNVDLVEVPLRIRTTKPLRAEDLRIVENGVEQMVRDVKAQRPPAHFAFIVDRSLSMGDGKLDAALREVRAAMGNLRAGDTSSLTVFNHNVTTSTLSEASNLVPSGGTSLRDAIASATSSQRTYAIVITDGGDRNSALSEDAALRRISSTHTTVNAIVLGASHTRFLDRAAENTGGVVLEASAATAGRALREILADINSRYVAIYQSSNTKSGWRAIDVKPRRRGLTIASARKGYFAQ